jgi:hypothetical protein
MELLSLLLPFCVIIITSLEGAWSCVFLLLSSVQTLARDVEPAHRHYVVNMLCVITRDLTKEEK